MHGAWLAVLVFASGCLAPAAPMQDEKGPEATTLLRMADAVAAAGQALHWNATLTYSALDERRCGPDNCEVRHFTIEPRIGGNWTLQAGLDWAFSYKSNNADYDPHYPSFNMTLRGPDGTHRHQSGAKFGSALHVDNPAPGEWTLEIRITHMLRDWDLAFFVGQTPVDPAPAPTWGTYHGTVLVYPTASPAAGPLPPDLVVRDLGQLRVEYAAPGQGNQYLLPSLADPTKPGCTVDEAEETGASRCLRFSIGVGNAGAGPFVLAAQHPADPAADVLGQVRETSMPAAQCVADGDGLGTLRPAGTVTFSRSHGHLHFDNILGYALFAYDWEGRTRGDQVATGAKLGYGPYAEAMVHDGREPVAPWELQVSCDGMQDPVGLNAGWYDYYLWWRTSQYVDIAGVPDGVYELVTTFDPDNNILESHEENNAGSVVLRLTGNQVEVLRPFRFP